jgi:uncharacterized membrane protein (Fun14 family)
MKLILVVFLLSLQVPAFAQGTVVSSATNEAGVPQFKIESSITPFATNKAQSVTLCRAEPGHSMVGAPETTVPLYLGNKQIAKVTILENERCGSVLIKVPSDVTSQAGINLRASPEYGFGSAVQLPVKPAPILSNARATVEKPFRIAVIQPDPLPWEQREPIDTNAPYEVLLRLVDWGCVAQVLADAKLCPGVSAENASGVPDGKVIAGLFANQRFEVPVVFSGKESEVRVRVPPPSLMPGKFDYKLVVVEPKNLVRALENADGLTLDYRAAIDDLRLIIRPEHPQLGEAINIKVELVNKAGLAVKTDLELDITPSLSPGGSLNPETVIVAKDKSSSSFVFRGLTSQTQTLTFGLLNTPRVRSFHLFVPWLALLITALSSVLGSALFQTIYKGDIPVRRVLIGAVLGLALLWAAAYGLATLPKETFLNLGELAVAFRNIIAGGAVGLIAGFGGARLLAGFVPKAKTP